MIWSHYAICPVLELLRNSLCDPLTKKCGDPYFKRMTPAREYNDDKKHYI